VGSQKLHNQIKRNPLNAGFHAFSPGKSAFNQADRHCTVNSSAHMTAAPSANNSSLALEASCEAFLSNDAGLRRLTELRVLIMDELEL
jgi:hypothetical protein